MSRARRFPFVWTLEWNQAEMYSILTMKLSRAWHFTPSGNSPLKSLCATLPTFSCGKPPSVTVFVIYLWRCCVLCDETLDPLNNFEIYLSLFYLKCLSFVLCAGLWYLLHHKLPMSVLPGQFALVPWLFLLTVDYIRMGWCTYVYFKSTFKSCDKNCLANDF